MLNEKLKRDEIARQLKVEKVYLEKHRDLIMVEQKTLEIAKKFFKDGGIEGAGDIKLTVSKPNRFQTFCDTNSNSLMPAADSNLLVS